MRNRDAVDHNIVRKSTEDCGFRDAIVDLIDTFSWINTSFVLGPVKDQQ